MGLSVRLLPPIGLITLFALSGCVTARVELSAERFDDTALASGAVAVGPVVQVGGAPVQSHQAETMRNELTTQIGKRRGYIRMNSFPFPHLIHLAGETAEKALQPKYLAACGREGIRHLLLIELTGNAEEYDIEHGTTEETEEICDENGNVIGKRVVRVTYETRARSTRTVAARFKVVEASTGRIVWVTRSSTSRSRVNREECPWTYPPPPPHPMAPDAGEVGCALVRAAVKMLPRQW